MNLDTTLKSHFSFWDALAQLLSLGFIVLIIVLIVLILHSNNRRKNQLNRIEEKIDNLNQQVKRCEK